MAELTEVASGLRFPEGPVAMPDGSLLFTEIFGPRLSRLTADGTIETVAEVPGGPNGAAIGPDGACYITNNGGCFTPYEMDGRLYPGRGSTTWTGGSIDRVDLMTGELTTLYTECDGNQLRAPNDLVFDAHGGMWFTDHGVRHGRFSDRTGIYYAKADGSMITEAIFPVDAPNGIGLSPAGDTVYYAETQTGRVYQRRITAPGQVARLVPFDTSHCLCGLPGMQLLDSLAVDSAGNVCVATIFNGGVTTISPEGEVVDFLATDDKVTTNICFGGPELRTAYITGGSTGRIWTTEWPRPGLALNYLND